MGHWVGVTTGFEISEFNNGIYGVKVCNYWDIPSNNILFRLAESRKKEYKQERVIEIFDLNLRGERWYDTT